VASVDEILKSPALPPLQRVSDRGGDRVVGDVRLAERLRDLHEAPEAAFVVLARGASAEVVDDRLDSDPDQRLALQLACRARLLG